MFKRPCRLAALCLVLLLPFSCSRDSEIEKDEPPQPNTDLAEGSVYVPNTINVRFSEEMAEEIERDLADQGVVTRSTSPGVAELFSSLGIDSMTRLFPYAGEFEPRTRAEGLHRWYKIKYKVTASPTRAVASFENIPGVEIAEPVSVGKIASYFNDPLAKNQWHYTNDGTLTKNHKAGADVNVLPVWKNYTTGSRNVIVSVVDGGIDPQHEDLADAYVGGRNFVTGGQVTGVEHGTHVAGVIGAVNNNGKGISGLAGGDAAKGVKGVGLLSCQVFYTNSLTGKTQSGDFSTAIKWGADNGAVISQNSWGYSYDSNGDGKLTGSELTTALNAKISAADRAAVDYFIKYAGCDNNGNQLPNSPMKGGVVIFAAGNDGIENGAPANYEPIIAVGSIAPDYSRAYYSNYGDWVDIAAPGGDANYSDGQVYSTLPGNKYGWMQGTSMACPHVSGVAALIVSNCGGQGFTNEMLKERLIKGARSNVLSANAKIGPLVDALGAITYGGSTPPEVVTDYESSVSANVITLTWKVTRDQDDKKAYGYLLLASKDRQLYNDIRFNNLPQGIKSVSVETGEAAVGTTISGSLTDLDFSDTYYVGIVGFDYNRNYSAISEIRTINTQKNNPPVVSTEYSGDIKVPAHSVVTIPFTIEDPDGHAVTVTYQNATEADKLVKNPVTGIYELTITGNMAEPGKYSSHIIAKDSWDQTDFKVDFEILENHPPVVIKEMDDIIVNAPGEKFTIDMKDYVEDPDGESLKYTVNIANVSVLHINPKGDVLNGTALAYGMTDVTIRALDAKEKYCELKFKVAVPDPDKPVSVYPNPVKDNLYVGTGSLASTTISVYSQTGRKVFESTSDVSIVAPAQIDMSGQAPGKYVVKVKIGSEEYQKTIVKI